MKRRDSPLDIFVLVALCVLGVVLGRMQNAARSSGRVDGLTSLAHAVVGPVSGPAGSVTHATGEFFGGLFSARQLTLENQRLRALANAAELYNSQLTRLQGEIDRLRVMQGFGPVVGKSRVKADVVGFAAYENRITLNVGANQGVRPGMPVEAPEGLVGTIQIVEATQSQALLVTSAGLTLGAMDIDRNPPPAGLMRGEDANRISVTFQDPKAPVEIGDRIVTSGFSKNIPRGIIIGRVISVEADEEEGLLRAKVFPAISVGTLREVHILK